MLGGDEAGFRYVYMPKITKLDHSGAYLLSLKITKIEKIKSLFVTNF